MSAQPEKKKELLAWLAFVHAGQFTLQIPVNSNVALPAMNTGDAVLLADRERKVATGVRRIYLIRHETDCTTFYFDRIADFATPYKISMKTVSMIADLFIPLKESFAHA